MLYKGYDERCEKDWILISLGKLSCLLIWFLGRTVTVNEI
jgi:hypothetical protein